MSKHARLSILIICVLLMAMIAQCGAPPSTEPVPTEAEVEKPAVETSAPEPSGDEAVSLTMWGNHPEWKDPVLEIVAAFEAAHPNIKVEADQKPADTYPVALNTAMAAGEAPDLIGFYPGPALAEAANSGKILELTGKVDTERLTQSGQAASKVGDKVYGVPAMGAYTVGLFYHKGIFEEHGLEPPTTWEELLSVSEQLKEAGVPAMIMPAKDAIIPYFFYIMAASSILGPEGFEKLVQGDIKLTDEELVQAAQLTHDMAEYFQEGYLSTSYVEGKALFARELGAMMIGGSADYSGYREVNPDIDVGVVAFPPPAGGGVPATTSGMELVYAVNSETEHPDEAITFLNWFTTDEAGQMVADNITLTTVQDIVPSDNPVLAEMVRASENDVRVWYEIPATAGVLDVFGTQGQRMFTDDISVEEFSQMLQDSITPTEAEASAPESSSGEAVSLTMWGNHPEWKDPVLEIVAAFEAEHPNIKVEVDQKPADTYPVALNTAVAAGEAPDLIGFYPGPALAEAANSGKILEITGKVDSERLTQSGQAASMVGDKVYGVPAMGAYTVGLFYHKGIFEEHGLVPPTTWEELIAVSEKLKEAGVPAMIMPAKDAIIPYFFYIMAASSVLGPEGYEKLVKGEIKLTDDELVQVAQLTHDMAQYFQDGYLSTSYVEGKALFARELGAMMIGGSADYSGYREVNPDIDVGVVAFPPPASGGAPATTSGMELVYAVNSETEHPDEAITFLNWFTTDEAGQMVADNITLTTVQDIVPSDNPVLAEMVRASENDVRVWYEIPATAGVLDVFGTQGQRMFTDDISVEEFSQMLQDSITPAE